MKLNVAAALSQSERQVRAKRVISVILASLFFLSSGVALALEGIDLSNPSEETDEGGCSRLVQIKYPFLSCTDGEIGLVDRDDDWENSRQIPLMSDWTEGDGIWGPSPNGM